MIFTRCWSAPYKSTLWLCWPLEIDVSSTIIPQINIHVYLQMFPNYSQLTSTHQQTGELSHYHWILVTLSSMIILMLLFPKELEITDVVHGLGTEVLHPPPPSLPTTFHEWYHFVQGNDMNQNRGVPNDLIEMYYAIWAIFKMAAFEKDQNNKRSIYDCYWSIFCIIIVLSRFRELYKSE